MNFHLLFNLALAAVFLGNVDRVAALLLRWLPDPPRPLDPGRPLYLERAALDSASVALANAARETLRMSDLAAAMLDGTLELLRPAMCRSRARNGERSGGTPAGRCDSRYLAAISGEQTPGRSARGRQGPGDSRGRHQFRAHRRHYRQQPHGFYRQAAAARAAADARGNRGGQRDECGAGGESPAGLVGVPARHPIRRAAAAGTQAPATAARSATPRR